MTLGGFLILLFISAVVGGIAQAIVGISRRGCLASIAIGLIGALIGNFFARKANLPDLLPLQIGDSSIPIVWSIFGAVLFVAVLSLLTGRTRK